MPAGAAAATRELGLPVPRSTIQWPLAVPALDAIPLAPRVVELPLAEANYTPSAICSTAARPADWTRSLALFARRPVQGKHSVADSPPRTSLYRHARRMAGRTNGPIHPFDCDFLGALFTVHRATLAVLLLWMVAAPWSPE